MRLSHEFAAPPMSHSVDFSASSSLITPTSLIRILAEQCWEIRRYARAFGSTVTFRRDDGRVQKYRIVGEDEADPKAGSISYVSPVARHLMGKAVGDEVGASGQNLEIISIS